MGIVSVVKSLIFKFLTNRKLEVSTKTSLLTNSFEFLKSKEFDPKFILDIGANHGTWTRDMIKFFPDSIYILIEPQAYLERSIEDLKSCSKIKFYPIGLGNKNGILSFSINQSDDSSSFKPTDSGIKGYAFVDSIPVQMKTLDAFLEEENLPIPDIVKIDTEGLDLEVLEGASSIFGLTECILIEASIHQKAFPNSLLKVMNYMDERGYEVFDFTDLNRPFSNGLLWLVEIFFLKKKSKYLEEK